MKNRKAILTVLSLLILILFHPFPAGAARPLSVDDAGTVEAGSFELEAAYGYEDFDASSQGLSLGLKHGITGRMDLGVGTGWQFDPDDGPESMEIGVKWSLLAGEENRPGVSVSFGFAPGDFEYSLNVILSQPLGAKFTLHLNGGYSVPEALADVVVFWGGALEFAAHDLVNLMAEAWGEEDLSAENEDCRSWLLGGNVTVTDFLVFDLGAGTKLSEDPGWFLTAGTTLGF